MWQSKNDINFINIGHLNFLSGHKNKISRFFKISRTKYRTEKPSIFSESAQKYRSKSMIIFIFKRYIFGHTSFLWSQELYFCDTPGDIRGKTSLVQ